MSRRTISVAITRRDKLIAEACLENAEDLITSAEALLNVSKHNIAYHLAVLALEELGKRDLIIINNMSRVQGDIDTVSESKLDDHVAKLFWSFFFQLITKEKMDQRGLDQLRGFAKFLHTRRQEALYVDARRKPFKRPKNVLLAGEAENVISLARAQTEIAKAYVNVKLTSDRRQLVAWFLNITSNEQWRTFVFSTMSMDKLVELGNFPQWVEWLRKQQQIEIESFTSMIEADRAKIRNEIDGGLPRWQFQIKLRGLSHKLKQTIFNDWNRDVEWVKFEVSGTKQKQELSATITASDHISIDHVYLAGRALADRIILGLNIGSLGFFWWEYPQYTARYFEKLHDLQSQRPIVLSETPELKIDWGLVILDMEVMGRIKLATAFLPFPSDGEAYAPFQIYLEGLSFLATINVHRRHEYYAFRAFYDCFWAALTNLGGHDTERSQQTFISAITHGLGEYSGISELYAKGFALSQNPPQPVEVTLEDVAWMKRVLDLYFLTWLHQQYKMREENADASSVN